MTYGPVTDESTGEEDSTNLVCAARHEHGVHEKLNEAVEPRSSKVLTSDFTYKYGHYGVGETG